MKDNKNTFYSKILKSSALVGGAQGLEIIIRMIRIKCVAMLLGPSGVGLIGLYQSTIDFVARISRFGIGTSAVRQVAGANSEGDMDRLGRTVKTISRTCWITGIFGWLIALVFCKPLSRWIFENSEHALSIALLGSVVFITAFYESQRAVLQGVRRIKDLAVVMVLSAFVGTILSILLYAWLKKDGIIIALPAVAAVNFAFSRWYAKRVNTPKVIMTWKETAKEAYPLVTLGFAFMWSGILTTGVAFITRSLIIRGYGIDSAGIYQAAWGISGLFASFILNAMGKDFYPGLSEVANNNKLVNQMVNEQIEIGILIALPGLLATLAFSPLVIKVFYTSEFALSAEMLPWFVLGIFGRIISWPMGFIQMAKGASMTFSLTETISSLLHLFYLWIGMRYFGVLGVAIAFAVLYACYTIIIYGVARKLSQFRWSHDASVLIFYSALFICAQFAVLKMLDEVAAACVSLLLILGSSVYCVKQLTVRLGPDHRLSKLLYMVLRYKRKSSL